MGLIDLNNLRNLLSRRKLSDEVVNEIIEDLEKSTTEQLNRKVKEFKNKQRVVANDQKKEHAPAKSLLTKEQIKSLPGWVRKDLENAHIVGKSKQVIQIGDGRKYHLNNKLNHLSGAKWTFFINSIINSRFPTSGPEAYAHSIRKIHPSPKPPQLMRDIIEFFTKEDELVFDYFSGVGGTQLGASLCGRGALGIDLDEKYHNAYKQANDELELTAQPTITGDSIHLLKDGKKIEKYLNGREFSLILIDPPYGDMMSREKTGQAAKEGRRDATPFTSDDKDLGNMDWKTFCKLYASSLSNALRFLKDKGHIVVFIKDLQPDGDNLNLLHTDLIENTQDIDGIQYIGTKIWADHSVNLYPYGYPDSFVSTQIHQYIMVFKYTKVHK